MDIPKISQWCAEFFLGGLFSIFFLLFEALVSWLTHQAWWWLACLLYFMNGLLVIGLFVIACYSAWRGMHTPAKRHIVVNMTFLAGMVGVLWYLFVG